MKRVPWCAAAALLSFLAPAVSQAAPYYVAWSQLYDDTDSTRAQSPSAVALDSRGNVFVTGSETVSNGTGIYVAKYDALDGHVLWTRRINSGTTIFQMNAIAVDSKGDCVVTGSRNGGNIDYYTIKLKGDDGTNFWAVGPKTYHNTPTDGEDTALKVVCDNADDIIVTGRSVGNGNGFDWATVKYDKDDGTELAVDRYSQTAGNLNDVANGLAVDSSNNVYVAGTVQTGVNFSHFYIRKLKAADLTKLWDSPVINTGTAAVDSEGGATAVAVDANNNVVATGMARDSSARFGYFTIKFSSAGLETWRSSGPFSQAANGTPYAGSANRSSRPQPVGVSIAPDNSPIVTGSLLNASGDPVIRTVKYTSGGFLGGADEFWDDPSIDTGLGFGDTLARAVVADGGGNAIVVGETENEDGDTDLYLAKYDTLTGERVYLNSFTRSTTNPSQDKGVDVAVDRLGNIAALGTFIASKNGSATAGNNEFGTIKLNRFIASTGDDLPDLIPGVGDDAKVTAVGDPAISTAGPLAAKLTFKAGGKAGAAILVEGSAAGGTLLPAVKGQPAPVAPGDPSVNWVSFSDPVVAPNGTYAFAAKVSGPGTTANGIWANLNGTLKLVFRQGSVIPVTGSTDKFASLINLGISSNNLIALVKLAGSAATGTALVRVDQSNAGTVLLRTGVPGLMINGIDHIPKTITIFSPPLLEAGDGRWLGANGVVVRVDAVQKDHPTVKATAIVSILNAGAPNDIWFTGQAATVSAPAATYLKFSFPATAFGSSRFAVKATLVPRPAATNSAIIYAFDTMQFATVAEKGLQTNLPGLSANVIYSDFSDPIVNSNSAVAFIGTLKGPVAEVKSTTNKVIVLRTATGNVTGTFAIYARTGDFAKDSAGNDSTFKWTSFTSLALPGGTGAAPIFVGKMNTANGIGLWGRDSAGKVRLLLRQGQDLGGQKIRTFTLLNTLPKVMATARSFDAAGSVAVKIVFTNNKTAILRIGIP